MTGIPELVPPKTGLCWFGIRSLPPLLEAFEKEIEGVKASEDIEYIHRMRVASRRLRAALPLFRRCFPQKQYARWMHEIAGITQALGMARDMDVQIAFLLRFRKKRSASLGVRNHTGPGTANPMEPAIAYLLKDLRRKRRDSRSASSQPLRRCRRAESSAKFVRHVFRRSLPAADARAIPCLWSTDRGGPPYRVAP